MANFQTLRQFGATGSAASAGRSMKQPLHSTRECKQNGEHGRRLGPVSAASGPLFGADPDQVDVSRRQQQDEECGRLEARPVVRVERRRVQHSRRQRRPLCQRLAWRENTSG